MPLRYNSQGFQALRPSEWHDMSAERNSYVGMTATLSSAQESASADSGSETAERSSSSQPAEEASTAAEDSADDSSDAAH